MFANKAHRLPWEFICLGVQVIFRSLFVEQETGRLFIVYEVKIKSYSI